MKSKKIAIILFVTWTIILFLTLTFGLSLSKYAQRTGKKLIKKIKNEEIYQLETVEPDIRDYYVPNESGYLNLNKIPETDENVNFKFEVLTPNILEMEKGSYFTCKDISCDEEIGKIKITSPDFPNFQKIVEIKIKKEYPTNFEVYQKLDKSKSSKIVVNVGEPLLLDYFIENKRCTEKTLLFTYDDAFFEKVTDLKYIPLKTGKTKITVESLNHIKKEIEIEIKDAVFNDVTITDIKLFNNNQVIPVNTKLIVGNSYYFELFENETKVNINYQITSSNSDVISISDNDNLVINKAGSSRITIKHKDKVISEFNLETKNIIELPKLYINNELIEDNFEIVVTVGTSVHYSFSNNVTYKDIKVESLDKNTEIDNRNRQNYFVVTGNKKGIKEFKIIIDDGFQNIEHTYKINFIVDFNNPSLHNTLLNFIITKFGHFIFFAIEGILMLNLLCKLDKSKKYKVTVFILLGVLISFSSEFFQSFMPDRSASLFDACFNFASFSLVFLISLLILKLHKIRKNKKNKKINS